MSTKKKKFKQEQIKFLFDIAWEYIRGEVPERYPKKGITRVESVDADSAKREWINGTCIWGRRYKVLSVTEVNQKQTNAKQTRKSEPEHSSFDDIPDF
jgi:hypothetical protein